MRNRPRFAAFGVLFALTCILPGTLWGGISYLSYTGTLPNPETDAEFTFSLSTAGTVSFETWSFGGGTNAAGQTILPGGFDPLIALFSGSGPNAEIVVDGSNIPLADGDTLFNAPYSFVGNCPPAGTVAIGVNNDCGDDFMQYNLAAGIYTLVVSDGNYVPNAVYDNGKLSEGFTDYTPGPGQFSTCDTDGSCITPSGQYAVDIVSSQSGLGTVPEPDTLPMFGVGLAALAAFQRFRSRRRTPHIKGERI